MKPFVRVLKIAARRRWPLIGILLSSLIVAVLWGTNITTVYPMVEIVFKGDNVQAYLDQRIEQTASRIDQLESQIAELKTAGTGKNAELLAAESKLSFSTKVLGWMQWSKPYVDQYAPTQAFQTLVAIMIMLTVFTAIKLVALMINMLLVQYISERTAVDLRDLFFRRALSLDLDRFGENGSADLTARLTNDIAMVSAGLSVILGRLVREPLKMIVCVGGAAIVCPRLLLLVMVVTPVVGLTIHHLSRAIRRASRRVMEEMSQLYGILNNSFSGIRVIKAFNTQAHERARFSQGAFAYFRKSMKMAFYNTLARSTTEMLGIITVGLAIIAGGYLVLNQKTHLLGMRMTTEPLSFAQILLFFGFLIGANDPARKLADVWSGLQKGIAATTRVFEIIDQPARVRDPAIARDVARPHSQIEFKDVRFQYPAGPMVLRGVDLMIPHGETVAVVGPNGSGKSTIVSLMCRFDDPQSGKILLDDVPIDQMRVRDLRRRIALVTQRTVLFDDTIENNIRYGTPAADMHAVVRAAKMAFADDFIRRKTPDGYDTILGSNGVQLSGGQMQRIALARAFLRQPDILILDEATSQIDLESEQLIHQALSKYLVDRTGLMITHRPTSLTMADRVIVIEGGKVSDCGRHEELLARNRFYQSLCGHDRMSA